MNIGKWIAHMNTWRVNMITETQVQAFELRFILSNLNQAIENCTVLEIEEDLMLMRNKVLDLLYGGTK